MVVSKALRRDPRAFIVQEDRVAEPGRWHTDPRISTAQIITIVGLIFAAGGAWWQLNSLSDTTGKIGVTIQQQSDRIGDTEQRITVLESQRKETNRRLDEIRDDVRWVRERLERGTP